ncbi:Centaurin-gamma-1A [Fasciola gigantica]|uniref:Centaurin-gamma-1A n=1 Tax=Fasciola gigantica TaxID=46835 RepID=A0A504YZR6_FASGI|nr:Centaurin-gamma-1A [Fasciola gigantica]
MALQGSDHITCRPSIVHPNGPLAFSDRCLAHLHDLLSSHEIRCIFGVRLYLLQEGKLESNEAITPSSTPTHSRKNRRKSNLFQKKNEEEKERDKKINGIGSGRAIPLKQGFLYKRTCKPLSKEWKTKKYVTLTDDARLTYHPSIHVSDYMASLSRVLNGFTTIRFVT